MPDNHQRLPFPGEQPTTIHRPRRRKRPSPVKNQMWGLSLIAMVVGVLLLGIALWRWTAIPVTLVVNGLPVEVDTHRRTVGGVVRQAGYRLDETIYLDPPPGTLLEAEMVITLGYYRRVLIHQGGQTLAIETHLDQPEAILREQGITPGAGMIIRVDRAVYPSGPERLANPDLAGVLLHPREISLIPARQVIISERLPGVAEPAQVSFQTGAQTVGEALAGAGYLLYEADRLTPAPGTLLDEVTTTITIERALPIRLYADGITHQVRTHQTTVGALLDELGLALTGSDYLIPAPETNLVPEMAVRLVRVREETIGESEALPYETRYLPDPTLPLDEQREISPGQAGEIRRLVRVRYEDGQIVSRIPAGEQVIAEPEPRVIAYGTQIVIHTLQTPQGELHYWRKLRVLVTSYSPSGEHRTPDDPYFGTSGTGGQITRGVIATDPRVIPLYTWLYVPGYGTGQALDVGGAVKGMRIDLGYTDEEFAFWNDWVEIYLLLPVPPVDQIVWVLPGS